MNNLALGRKKIPLLKRMQEQHKDFFITAHDDFLPGTARSDWYDD
jgi:hypothetical protein